VFTPGSAQAWFSKLQLLKVITNMKKGLLNSKMRALAVLLNGYTQPSTMLCLLLSTVVTFSPAAVFADALVSDAASEQDDALASSPKMGDCQFYVKTKVTVNIDGKKVEKDVLAGAGAYIETVGNAPLDAECYGKCDMKGPNVGECVCGYQSFELGNGFGGSNTAGGTTGNGAAPKKTLHACECFELIGE
jgi:hypothetical protein